ncbi:phytoene desaturase family protein [Cellulosimicrobium cellulans]|uniref:phytoene desaturase family protein n=1 Tax=Cellulosimicrobium cellulans TaxID=1710 RepID=UPI002096C0E9|nr:phytoene desaturase family protein [Cellulosimicrobium cellulans]MCO7275408.1 phytoene desaturase family protein [Cellulosimicrobium cellulans]
MRAPRVVVVGGGISGLATAALLARGGAAVTLLERHADLGGRAGTLELDGFRFDTGPSWYFMPEVVEHFFALLGARVEDHLDLVPLDPAYRVFFEPDGPGGAASTFELSASPGVNRARLDAIEPGAGDRVAAYAATASEAYGLALDHFLYTTFERPDRALAPEVLRRLPRLAALLREPLADRAARAVEDPRLRQLLGYHAVFLGSSPYRAPALYSLMSHLDLVDGVRYPRGGMHTLIEAVARLARAEGAELRTGADVAGIEVAPGARRRGRVTGVRLASGELVEADLVVSAADRHHTETALLAPRWADLPAAAWDDKGPGISALLVLAGVRGALPELAHHSLFFTRDWPANFDAVLGADRRSDPAGLRVPDPASLYVSRTSATDGPSSSAPAAPPGHENLFLLVPFPADPTLGADAASRRALDALADRYLAQVGRWAGIEDLPGRVVTRRVLGPAHFATELSSWRGGALGMEHTLRQSALWRPGTAARRVDGLYHAGGGSIPGVGLPMCLISAELVAKRLLGETSARPLPTPLRPGYLAASRRPERIRPSGARPVEVRR